VYSFTCVCGALYIGETGRLLITRINEHLNIRTKNLTVVGTHIINSQCQANKNCFKIVKSFGDQPFQKRKFYEKVVINKHKHNPSLLNVQDKYCTELDFWF